MLEQASPRESWLVVTTACRDGNTEAYCLNQPWKAAGTEESLSQARGTICNCSRAQYALAAVVDWLHSSDSDTAGAALR